MRAPTIIRAPRRKEARGQGARLRERPRPVLVAIAGGSASGKSWLADKLQRALAPGVVRLCLDDFYLDRSHLPPARRARLNFDHPRAIDWQGLEGALKALLAGRLATVPAYDFKTHTRLPSVKRVHPQRLILLEGLWPLKRRAIRRLADLSVFLHCPARLRLQRRIQRDRSARGRTRASVEQQFRHSVEPMHVRFVIPQLHQADLVFQSTCGPRQVRQVLARIEELLSVDS